MAQKNLISQVVTCLLQDLNQNLLNFEGIFGKQWVTPGSTTPDNTCTGEMVWLHSLDPNTKKGLNSIK